jgi:hypothetical protein
VFCRQKVHKCPFCGLAYFLASLAKMLANLTVGSVETEPHIVLL